MSEVIGVTQVELDEAVEAIKVRGGFVPQVALVLGSGLGALSEEVEDAVRIPYEEIPGMPTVGVEGHRGEMVFGLLSGKKVVMLSGRAHFYEGHNAQDVVFGVRVCGWLGAKTLVLTNAAGVIVEGHCPGELMVISDQIHSFSPCNPLRGKNPEWLGPRFPDMTAIYDPGLVGLLMEIGQGEKLDVFSGVYAGLAGPQYESPAEIHLLSTVGADAVGMSTTAEAIAARHMGMSVAGVSCITNMAAGKSGEELSHDEVKEVALQAGSRMRQLVRTFVERLPGREQP
jgi:purine-nucleoside phosphorylase